MMLPLVPALLLFAAQEEPPAPLVRVTSSVVEITLLATGKTGGTVSNLTADDRRVWDNGREQCIASFERIGLSPRVPPSAPGVFSNRLGGSKQVYSVILLDALNTRWGDSAYARAEVVRTIAQIRPEERVALFVLGNGLRVLHDFSSDTASLLSRLNAAPTAVTGDRPTADAWPFSAEFGYSQLFSRPVETGRSAAFFQTRRILDTFRALEAIAGYVRGVPGRKNLLWVSAGFPLIIGDEGRRGSADIRTFGDELDRAARALNAANLAVYPIDARGLTPGNPYVNVSTMKELARQTGGTAYYNRNDLHRAVREALDDAREVYSLSYVPQPFAEDGRFHRIRIQTAHRGVALRYRQGYYAPSGAEPEAPATQARFRAALASPLDVSEIGITAHLERGDGDPPGMDVLLSVDPADLHLQRQGDRWTGALSVALLQLGPAGEQFGQVIDHLELAITDSTFERAAEQGLRFRRRWERRPEAISLRIAILDEKRARVGSLTLPLGQAVR